MDPAALERLVRQSLAIDTVVKDAVAELSQPSEHRGGNPQGTVATAVWQPGPGQRQAGGGAGYPDHPNRPEQSVIMEVAGTEALHRVAYGDEHIVFTLRRQPSRVLPRIAIHVEPDGRVEVDAPSSTPLADVLAAVRKRSRWISQHVSAARARLAHVLPREYVSGESIHYLGKRYRLKVILQADAEPEAKLRGAFVVVRAPNHDAAAIGHASTLGTAPEPAKSSMLA